MNKPAFMFRKISTGFRSICLIFVVCVAVSACENDQKEIQRVTSRITGPTEEIKGLQTLYSDSGRVKVKVTAAELDKIPGPPPVTELPGGVHIEFFDEQLQVVSELTARYAIHYELERVWEARNKVVVVNRKGETLKTEKLIWNEKKELLTSDAFVTISTAEETIYGEGFEADQDFSSYKIFKVKGIITVRK